IRTINTLTAIKKDGDNVEGPTISDYSLKELKIRLQRLVEPLLTDEKLAKYNIVDYNPDDGTITISESNLRKFLEENPKEDWEVLYKVAEEAKNLSNLATNEAYVASLLRGYSSQKRRLEERIMEYQEYLQQKEEFLKKRFARIETYISSLQNMQAKINQILIAQMVLTNKK
ncbi:MAG: flagellar filament capping protein FliD, partial [Thermococcus sp.]